jgi:hypothetical protein
LHVLRHADVLPYHTDWLHLTMTVQSYSAEAAGYPDVASAFNW